MHRRYKLKLPHFKGPFGTPDSMRSDRIMVDSIRPDKNLILCNVWYVTV